MKVVLIQPRTPQNSSWEALNLGYLKAYASRPIKGIEWKFYSGYFDSDEEIVKGCEDADYVGFSCTTPQIVHAKELIRQIKRNGRPQFIIGGVHASAQPRHLETSCDYVVQGEGEMSLVQILQGKTKNGIVRMPYISSLDSLPFPDRKFIKQERNIAVTERNDHERIAAIFSSRGCPYRCAFCSSREVWGFQARLHSPQRVVDEMEDLVKTWNIQFIKFSDDTFTINEDRVARICELITNNGLDVPWGCNIRANTSDHLLRKMKEANCREVWIGAESGSPHVLREMKKGITVSMVEHVFEETKRLGLYRRVYFMVGWPTETEEDIKLTRSLAEKIEADQYGFSMLCPFPNNVIFQPWMLDALDWSIADEYIHPWGKTNYIDHDRLVEIQKDLISEFQDRICFRQKEKETNVI
jgi:radical SAM superfamily enzyme YgiQ (UPF0313 family)